MAETAEKLFSELLEELDANTVTAEKTFQIAVDVAGGDELQVERNFQALKNRAAELGISRADFEKFRGAYKRNVKAKAEAEMRKRQEEDHSIFYATRPEWILTDGSIDESSFCKQFLDEHDLRCISGAFYSPLGLIPEEKVKNIIQAEISPYIQKRLASHVNDIVEALKNFSYSDSPTPNPNVIPTRNGEIDIDSDGNFTHVSCFNFCLNRIAAEYHPDAPEPELWLKFLNDLLYPEDIPTLQEFLGYCLVPTTKAQKMLMIIGSGGEGKSVVGTVAKNIFGHENIATGKLNDLDENRFAAANLENKLLFIDDDMATKASEESAVVKQIVTSDGTMHLERKGVQGYEGNMYCRLMAFGNRTYQTLHDASEGAFRRRIILFTKPKPEGRKDDKDLPQKLARERDGILLWMLDGLKRLMKNDWEFTISDRARENLEQAKEDSFNLLAFLKEDSIIRLGVPDTAEFSSDIYTEYELWCEENGEKACVRKTVISYLRQNADRLHILYSEHVTKNGKRARGFYNVQLLKKHRNGISPF